MMQFSFFGSDNDAVFFFSETWFTAYNNVWIWKMTGS